jgi:twitching motility protein PilU
MDLTTLLIKVIEQKGSDLFISADAPPQIKVEGKTVAVGKKALTAQETHQLAYSIMNDEQMKTFEHDLELNIALNLPNAGRFRVNVFSQRGELALVARYIKSSIPSIDKLGLPLKLQDLIMEERGLLLVVGGTGTGKSTTLASMIDYRARTRSGHILTIEDPVEFIHSHKTGLVNQREVGLDTHSYANALKNAMREAPDVILIGEIRDRETMQHALAYAETGHLCVSTLHASNANQALDRILNFFPETAHSQILMDLSLHLKAIVAQRLCHGIGDKRVAAVEIMTNTPYISDLIQKGKVDVIKEAMTQSKGVQQTFDDALYELTCDQKITQEEALRHADSRNNLSLKFRLEKGALTDPTAAKKEVAFNKRAPFESYHTFMIRPMKVSRERRPDIIEVLTKGICHVFLEKGLEFSTEDPDIEIRYAFGLESTKKIKLKPIKHESDQLVDITPDTEDMGTLLVNVRDLRTKQDVWRANASRPLSGPLQSQEQINKELSAILKDYPTTR